MTVLVLAGTSEARELLQSFQDEDVIASLAGVTRAPDDLGVKTRIGGFGGANGFKAFLQENEISAVLDATHPFAAQMTTTAASVCKAKGVAYSILQRPGWDIRPDDKWHYVDHIAEIEFLIPSKSTVFIGTGRQTLDEYDCIHDRHLFVRVIDAPVKEFPFENGEFLVGKPPFSVEEEIALFQKKGIDWLVVKNSGGWKSKGKLDAAAKLGLPVAILKRPQLPDAKLFTEVTPAAHWLRAYL